MKNIIEVFHLHPTEGDVGIEIEAENHEGIPFPRAPEGWRGEMDGSLRGESIEYVLGLPCPIAEVNKNLKALSDQLEKHEVAIDYSFRAGVHVHLNMQKYTILDLVKFAAAYYVLEEALVDWCGSDRVGNHFCLRAVDAEYVIDFISQSIKNGHFDNFSMDVIRYTSMNFSSLSRYGSLEFRALGTEPNFARIEKWANLLYDLRDNATNYEVAGDMLYDFSVLGPREWAEKMMGKHFEEIKGIPELDRKLRDGMRLAQDFIFQSGY